MSNVFEEQVLDVHHWTDRLFSFSTTRDPGCRFRSGQFVMLGLPAKSLPGEGRPLMRAYSIASPHYADVLDFFSIKVPDGPLTSQLQQIRPGDRVVIGRKATGTLVVDNLRPGATLYLLATGTGLAPFLSTIRDPETYERFDKVVLVHGVRTVAELAYRRLIEEELPQDEFLGELISERLIYYPTVTREEFRNRGRITHLITTKKLFDDIGLPALDAAHDRVMMCGSPALLADMTPLLEQAGFCEGNTGEPGDYVVEKAFAE
jgi:ferredoxin/flavodoxin---NADP+ reductase